MSAEIRAGFCVHSPLLPAFFAISTKIETERHFLLHFSLRGSGFVKYLRTDGWAIVLIHSAGIRKRRYIVQFTLINYRCFHVLIFSCVAEVNRLKTPKKIFVPNEKEVARGWTTGY